MAFVRLESAFWGEGVWTQSSLPGQKFKAQVKTKLQYILAFKLPPFPLQYLKQALRVVQGQRTGRICVQMFTSASAAVASICVYSELLSKRLHGGRHIQHMDILQKVTPHKLGRMAICWGEVAHCIWVVFSTKWTVLFNANKIIYKYVGDLCIGVCLQIANCLLFFIISCA